MQSMYVSVLDGNSQALQLTSLFIIQRKKLIMRFLQLLATLKHRLRPIIKQQILPFRILFKAILMLSIKQMGKMLLVLLLQEFQPQRLKLTLMKLLSTLLRVVKLLKVLQLRLLRIRLLLLIVLLPQLVILMLRVAMYTVLTRLMVR